MNANITYSLNEEITKLYNRRDEVRISLLSLVHDDKGMAYEDGLGSATRLLVELHTINASLNSFEVL